MKIFGKDTIAVNVTYDADALNKFSELEVKDKDSESKLEEIERELKKMNLQLSLITDVTEE